MIGCWVKYESVDGISASASASAAGWIDRMHLIIYLIQDNR